MSKILLLVLCFITNIAFAGITTDANLLKADFWTKRNNDGDKVILTAAQIKTFNKGVKVKNSTVVDLSLLPETFSPASYEKTMTDYSVLNGTSYVKKQVASPAYKKLLRDLTNVEGLRQRKNILYAVAVKRTNLRNLPTGEGMFSSLSDVYYDDLQETTVEPSEPVVIYNISKNDQFYYVQTYNYRGWISKYDVALTDRKTWLKYVDPAKFLVVTAKNYNLSAAGRTVFHQQGAKILYTSANGNNYTIITPTRNSAGRLEEKTATITKTGSLNDGYLPYTSNNVIRLAFKPLGDVYGWGGLLNSVDCSSLVNNVYRTMGVILPRNADEQKRSAGVGKNLVPLTRAQRLDYLKTLAPGSTINLGNYHIMIYLGMYNNKPYVIHSGSSYYSGGKKIYFRKVVVSDLERQSSSGKIWLDTIDIERTYK